MHRRLVQYSLWSSESGVGMWYTGTMKNTDEYPQHIEDAIGPHMDADTGWRECIALCLEHGATQQQAERVARNLGRDPRGG